jgi:D-arabinose 1-dehydrogenase-like Zn-dependent alcohol dehydrogenase
VNPVLVGALVAIASTVSPLVLAVITGRQRRLEKQQDWARQDQVRQRDRAEQQEDTRRLEGKVDVIHELVNSDKTAALQSELVALRGQVVLMKRVMALNEAAQLVTTSDEHAALTAVEARAAEIEAVVADRLIQQEQIDRQSGR